jgi:hypothetical protein
MRLTEFNENIPDWLKENINKICPYCNGYIVDNDNLTQRRCVSEACPGHVAQRMDKLAKYLGVKNFGPATALSYIQANKLTSHVQIIPYIFKEKPVLQLWEIGELSMIKGLSTRWRDICLNHSSMESFISSGHAPREVVLNKEYLKFVESYFTVKEPLSGHRINIMMSGSLDGYKTKADFVRAVNEKYGEFIQLVDIGKRKSNCHFLIREEHTTDHEKTKIAKEAGIPILSPSELIEKIEASLSYINERG